MRQAISLSDLKKYAEKLPASFDDGRYYKMAIAPALSPYYHVDPRLDMATIHYQTIEFRARRTRIDGVEVTAWFYHDVLVKVTV